MFDISRTDAFTPLPSRLDPAPPPPQEKTALAVSEPPFDFFRLPPELQIQILSRCESAALAQFSRASRSANALVSDFQIWRSIAEKINCPLNRSSSLAVYKQVLRFIDRIRNQVASDASFSPMEELKRKMVVPCIANIQEAQAWIEEKEQLCHINFLIQVKKSRFRRHPNLQIDFPAVVENLNDATSASMKKKAIELWDWKEKNKTLLQAHDTLEIWKTALEAGLEGPNLDDFQTPNEMVERAAGFGAWVEQNREVLRQPPPKMTFALYQLTTIPKEIGRLVHLTHVVFSNNFLSQLPQEFCQLTELLELNLEYNDFTQFPTPVLNLRKLRALRFGGNRLSSVPSKIKELAELRVLGLNRNALSSLPPEIGDLTKLETVYLSDNRIKSLPSEIGNWQNISHLDLRDNQIERLPSTIGMLGKLSYLVLSQNHLNDLPPDLSGLPLETLNLEENQFTCLPPQVFTLLSLKTLDLSANYIDILPPEVQKLTKLTWLVLRRNLLISLPPEIGNLQSLKILRVCDNRLSSLPSELGKLKNCTLDFSNNKLTRLPISIMTKPSLEIQNNPLSLRDKAAHFLIKNATLERMIAGAGILGAAYAIYAYPTTTLNALITVVDTTKTLCLNAGTTFMGGIRFVAQKLIW